MFDFCCETETRLKRSNDVTLDDLCCAEKLLIKATQTAEYDGELNKLIKLDPNFDRDGIIRVGGRLKRSSLSEEVKHPVILPGKCDATRLIVNHFHERSCHQGRGITLNSIRCAGFWIAGGVSTVSRYIRSCVTCRKLRRCPENQRMADLPADRLEPGPPFTYCGVDFFGPSVVRNGRKEEKRYGSLFTCLVSRGVHIEVAHSLSTDSFMNAFRRFLSRRGPIRQLRSDQGTNFIGASKELKDAMNEMDMDELKVRMLEYNCEWIFNPPTASHHGGSWERMIRTTRSILDSMMLQNKAQLSDEMLLTFMAEAESIVNGRPLCATTESSLEPLSPANLLTMKTSVVLPPPGDFLRDGKFSRKLWRRVQHLAELFWCRWRKEYVSCLQQRQKWNRFQRSMSIGDIVLLCDENLPRNQWELARVTDVKISDDGLVRTVTLFAGRRKTTLTRPVNKIVLLIPEDQ